MNEKSNIGSLFDSIAKSYDRFNHFTSFGIDIYWRRAAIKKLQPVKRLLDVAIGTGDFALAALRKEKAQHITGIDLSQEMMDIGKAKAEKAGYASRVSFVNGSALDMPFNEGEFEALTCAYGIRNFSDLDKGLAEMYRVLGEGGQLVILEFSYPSNRFVRWIYNFYFSHIMPLIGKLLSKNPGAFTYFRESVKNFIWGDEMLAHLRQAGFKEAEFRTLTFGVTTLYLAKK